MDAVDAGRYARQIALPGFGLEAQQALARARVLVIGAGGLGSIVLPALAAAGVGTLGIVDDDVVEASNLHRQTLHGERDLGRLKVESAAESLLELNSGTVVSPKPVRLDRDNAMRILAGFDLVIDGSDNFATRYLANDAAVLSGIPLVWGAISQYGGQLGAVWAPSSPNYRDLFPTPPPPGSVPSCAEGGVLPSVCGVVGALMATEAIKLITGTGEPLLGRVTTYDALTGGFRELSYAADPDGEPITGLIDYEVFCGIGAAGAASTSTDATTETSTETKDDRSMPITATELARALDSPSAPAVIDVREPWEASIASIPGSILVPLAYLDSALDAAREGASNSALDELELGDDIVVYCHLGVRSEHAVGIMRAKGFTAARSLDGGIEAWSTGVDSDVARY